MIPVPPANAPTAAGAPVYETLETVTPAPARFWASWVGLGAPSRRSFVVRAAAAVDAVAASVATASTTPINVRRPVRD
jgi:hypothetical protein